MDLVNKKTWSHHRDVDLSRKDSCDWINSSDPPIQWPLHRFQCNAATLQSLFNAWLSKSNNHRRLTSILGGNHLAPVKDEGFIRSPHPQSLCLTIISVSVHLYIPSLRSRGLFVSMSGNWESGRCCFANIDSSGWIQTSPRMDSHEDDLTPLFRIKALPAVVWQQWGTCDSN